MRKIKKYAVSHVPHLNHVPVDNRYYYKFDFVIPKIFTEVAPPPTPHDVTAAVPLLSGPLTSSCSCVN